MKSSPFFSKSRTAAGRPVVFVCLAIILTTIWCPTTAASGLDIHVFASDTCHACEEMKRGVLRKLQNELGDRIQISYHSLDDLAGFRLLLAYERHYGASDNNSLKLFVGSAYLSGKNDIARNLERTVRAELAANARTPAPAELDPELVVPVVRATSSNARPTAAVPKSLADRVAQFKPGAILLAGLIDGVNPCAFATLVFFVSLLTALHKSRGQILLIGACFSLSVFFTYLLLGLGAFRAVKTLSVSTGIATVLTLCIAVFTLVLAILSFRDYIVYRHSGEADNLTLRLPKAIKLRMNRLVSRSMRGRNLILGAFGLGVIVSMLESLCTGQVYLPAISLLVRDRGLGSRAFLWLVLYNLMFILPLLGVFGLALFGVSNRTLIEISRRHVGPAKLALGFLFLGLGLLLLKYSVSP